MGLSFLEISEAIPIKTRSFTFFIYFVLFCFGFFKCRVSFLCVAAMDALKLALSTRMASNSQRYISLCCLGTEIKAMHHPTRQKYALIEIAYHFSPTFPPSHPLQLSVFQTPLSRDPPL